MSKHILIVDDDPVVRDLVREYLQSRGYAVSVLHHGMGLQRRLQVERPDLVVLDIMMPELDGISALRTLRIAGDEIPVILLTARADVIDRVIGLELGADDYLGKPFDPSELVARIRTVLRRRGIVPLSGAAPEQRAPYRFGRFEINFPARELRHDGERIPLRSSEFAMLKIFVTHAMTVLTRAQLLEKLHGSSSEHRNRSLDVSIWRLRRLIEIDPSEPRYVQTVWGQGYVFVPDGEIGAAERCMPASPSIQATP
ncbi:response regulator [Paraburkholderia sp. BL10I2N1]|uniref:response regulator n=1 Tax=Paraburkholderia sp. BL10I2N1 TaxID=1938796 RepID=UPI0010612E51|nr:response regulator [Paraburkholderia sp. BL10I2N1]TDN67794.1 winged helix family two component transcriptional regulator [Paraburkholderia sp. BL10I2N1]